MRGRGEDVELEYTVRNEIEIWVADSAYLVGIVFEY